MDEPLADPTRGASLRGAGEHDSCYHIMHLYMLDKYLLYKKNAFIFTPFYHEDKLLITESSLKQLLQMVSLFLYCFYYYSLHSLHNYCFYLYCIFIIIIVHAIMNIC